MLDTQPAKLQKRNAGGATDSPPPCALARRKDARRLCRARRQRPRSQPSLDRPSVAVLPFANLSGDPQQDYFSDGMTEDIITELLRFSELMVIARNSSFQYKGKAVDIRQIGRDLGARYVLEGSVRRSGNRIRIAAQLIDAITGIHRWGERYDRELSATQRAADS
jgi:TolB-like protein